MPEVSGEAEAGELGERRPERTMGGHRREDATPEAEAGELEESRPGRKMGGRKREDVMPEVSGEAEAGKLGERRPSRRDDDARAAHNIALRFKNQDKFTGKLSEDLTEHINNYIDAAQDYNLDQTNLPFPTTYSMEKLVG